MTEKKVKTEAAAPKAVKKPEAAKAAAAPKAAPKKPAQEKKTPSGKTVTLVQVGSPIGRQSYQRATLIGLGLNKINRTRTLSDTPSTRGMIETVKHLVKIVETK